MVAASVVQCTTSRVTGCFNLPAVPLLQTPPLNWRLHMSNLQRESQKVHLNLQGKVTGSHGTLFFSSVVAEADRLLLFLKSLVFRR